MASIFKENDVQRNCYDAHVRTIDNDIDIAERLNTEEDKVTKDPPPGAMAELQTLLLSSSAQSETSDSEEVKGEIQVHDHSLSDSYQNNDCADLPNKSTVPCFVYGISSSFKRRKKEAVKSQIRRQTPSLSSSLNEEKLTDEKHLPLSMFCNENRHQSSSASPREMAEYHSHRTGDENDSSGPLLHVTSESSTSGINDETNAPHIDSADFRFPSGLSLQDKAYDLTTAQSMKDVPGSRADSCDQDTKHISYIAEFREETESSSAGGKYMCTSFGFKLLNRYFILQPIGHFHNVIKSNAIKLNALNFVKLVPCYK